MMTKKRFTLVFDHEHDGIGRIEKDNIPIHNSEAVEMLNNLYDENEQLYELIDFVNTLIAFKTSESCQKEWEKRLKELKE